MKRWHMQTGMRGLTAEQTAAADAMLPLMVKALEAGGDHRDLAHAVLLEASFRAALNKPTVPAQEFLEKYLRTAEEDASPAELLAGAE